MHDFFCPACGEWAIDHYVPISQRASESAPACRRCGGPTEWHPAVGAIDAKEPFQQFTFQQLQRDGSHKEVTVGSLHQMRQIERQSEVDQRNGEGQQLAWRDYSQDRNHMYDHAFATDPSERPVKSPRVSTARALRESQVNGSYGPGVSDATTSALGD